MSELHSHYCQGCGVLRACLLENCPFKGVNQQDFVGSCCRVIDTSREDRYSDEDFELYKAQARASKANTRMLLNALRGV